MGIGNYRDEEFEVVEGGMQDYNYIFSNCMELTVEVSCDKKPPAKTLVTQWENNYVSMLTMLQSVDGGVKGLVVLLTGCRRKSLLLLLPPSRSRSLLHQRGSTPSGSE